MLSKWGQTESVSMFWLTWEKMNRGNWFASQFVEDFQGVNGIQTNRD